MQITRRPSLLSDLFEGNMQSLVHDFFKEDVAQDTRFRPAMEVNETDTNYTILFALPGVSKNEIELEVNDDNLRITGSRPSIKTEGNKTHISEFRYGKFERVVQLPKNIASGKINASFENGLLEITLPKREDAQPRTISIK